MSTRHDDRILPLPTPSRRSVLQALSAGGAALCLGLEGCGVAPQGLIAAGPLADLEVGDLVPVTGTGVAVGLDEGGVYSVTTICTHLQCDMAEQGSVSAEELVCDCHNSRFDATGEPTAGPAIRPLDFFAVELDEAGELTVNADEVVAPEWRLEA